MAIDFSPDAQPLHLVLQPCRTHLQLGEHAPQRPALLDPPHPQVALHTGEPQLRQPGLPLGRPAGDLPRDRPAGPDARPPAGQPVLVEPVAHRARVHVKLASDAGGWAPSRHRPIGQVDLKGWETQLCDSCSQVLVGAGAPRVGGGHPARCGGDAGLVEQVADHRGGGGKLAGQLRGAGLLLAARSEVAGEVTVPLRLGVVVEATLVAVEDRKAAPEGQGARQRCWWWRYTCAWRAGRPTTPGDAPHRVLAVDGAFATG